MSEMADLGLLNYSSTFDQILQTGRFSTGDGGVVDIRTASPQEIENGIARRERAYRRTVRRNVWGFQTETQLEDAVCQLLSDSGISYQRQVRCKAGVIDVLTDWGVLELKHDMDREALIKAVGQVLLYSQSVGEGREPVILFTWVRSQEVEDMFPTVRALGIDLLEWPTRNGVYSLNEYISHT